MAGSAGLPHPDCSNQDGELKRLYVLANQQGSGLGNQTVGDSPGVAGGRVPPPFPLAGGLV